MEHIQYLELSNNKNYLSILPADILILIYDYININLNKLLKFIIEFEKSLSNEDIFNYFYKWDYSMCHENRKKIYPKYDKLKVYKIRINYNRINSTLDNINLIPIFYRPISKIINYNSVTMFEKHHIEYILGCYYTNSYTQKFKYILSKNNTYFYTCRESVLLAFLFCKIKYIFNGIELEFYATRKKKITKKELIENGFKHINNRTKPFFC